MTTPNTPTVAELLKEWEETKEICADCPGSYELYSPKSGTLLEALQEAVEVLKETAAGEATADYLAMDLLKKWGYLK